MVTTYIDPAFEEAARAAEAAYQARIDAFNARQGARVGLPPLTGAGATGYNAPPPSQPPLNIGAANTGPATLASRARSLGATGAKLAAKGALAAAPVIGAVGAMADTQADVKKVAESLGLDYDSFLGRIGANTYNFLNKTVNAATFGLYDVAGEKLGRLMRREPFFKPYGGAVTVPTPALTGSGAVPGSQSQVRAIDNAGVPPLYPSRAPVTTMTSADIDRGAIPVEGTGAIRNERTGRVIAIDSREAPGFGVSPAGTRPPSGLPDVGGFFGATAKLRQISQENALRAAQKRVELQYGGAAAQRIAAAENEALRTAAAIEHLRANPGDFAGAATVASGRSQGGQFSVPFPPMSDKEPVTRVNRATGAVERVMPTQPITMAQAIASAKKHGTYKSDAQVRTDIMKMPGYRLID